MDKINQIKKEIFTSMKMMDTTIKGIKESEEYKIAQAYNQGLRDAMAIFEREMKRWFTKTFEGGTAMDSRFFERKCFTITSDCLLEFMKEQKDDSSLIFNVEKDTKEVFLYSPAFDVEYNEDDIMDCVGRELGVEINNLFVDGDKYCAAIYLTVRKLE